MAKRPTDHAPNKENYGYVCHCRKCGGAIAMTVAEDDDLGTVVKNWLSMDNTYVERRRIDVIKNLEFCDHITEPS